MTAFEFRFWRKLRESFARDRIEEQRVIAETSFAARGFEDHTFRSATKLSDDLLVHGKRQFANEAGGALRVHHTLQLSQELGIVFGIRGGWASEAAGIDARRTVQEIYFDARIIGQDVAWSQLAIVQGFLDGIASKSVSVLLARRKRIEARKQVDFQRRARITQAHPARDRRAKFAEFARAGSSELEMEQ